MRVYACRGGAGVTKAVPAMDTVEVEAPSDQRVYASRWTGLHGDNWCLLYYLQRSRWNLFFAGSGITTVSATGNSGYNNNNPSGNPNPTGETSNPQQNNYGQVLA